jgi:N-acetyl-D-muramate 6-phosphate phosphatase
MKKIPTRAVLFDLDGTLIDSAPDLAGAANEMRIARGMPALSSQELRPMVGAGARGMLAVALQVTPADAEFATLREEFFQRYEARLTCETKLFDEMPAVLDALRVHNVPWGIVTNKAQRFTEPLVRALHLHLNSAAVVISGDTTPHSKPHPAPLLEASRRMNISPGDCVYVGDDLRDVQAGRSAGMHTVAAAWGYLGLGEPVSAWGADHVAQSPNELLNCFTMA